MKTMLITITPRSPAVDRLLHARGPVFSTLDHPEPALHGAGVHLRQDLPREDYDEAAAKAAESGSAWRSEEEKAPQRLAAEEQGPPHRRG